MKIHLHDHSGHIFTVRLARELAERGHDVVYGYSAQFESPHGHFDTTGTPGLRVVALSSAAPFDKYSPVKRTRYELSYARAWQRHLDAERPDGVIACNVPLFTLARMRRYFARHRTPWLLWHQDIYSRAIADEAARKLPGPVARLAGSAVHRLERAQVASADAVVAISDAFVAEYRRWGLRTDDVHVLPNWSPTDEVVPGERDNDWARRHGLPDDALRILYAGTLGRKHNPALLVELLDGVLAQGVPATLTVASSGDAADELAAATAERGDVRVLPFQPAEQVSAMLASADACVVLLEPSAAEFSVPSKVLSYLCAARATVALVPAGNAAAETVAGTGGFVGEPSSAGAAEAARWLVGQWREGRLGQIGVNGREFAVRTFDSNRIGGEFEKLLAGLDRGTRGH